MRTDYVIECVNEILHDCSTATANLLRVHLITFYDVDISSKQLAHLLMKTDLVKIKPRFPRQPLMYRLNDNDRT